MKEVKCPQCGTLTVYDTSKDYRPFCSERCKLIDLGAWADEKYAIPGEKTHHDVNQKAPGDEGFENSSPENGHHLH